MHKHRRQKNLIPRSCIQIVHAKRLLASSSSSPRPMTPSSNLQQAIMPLTFRRVIQSPLVVNNAYGVSPDLRSPGRIAVLV